MDRSMLSMASVHWMGQGLPSMNSSEVGQNGVLRGMRACVMKTYYRTYELEGSSRACP